MNPRLISRFLGSFLLLLSLLTPAAAQEITNIQAAQRPGTNLVDIDYDLTGIATPVRITLEVSADDGLTWDVPGITLSGDAGDEVTPATGLRLTWDAGRDWGGRVSDSMRYKIIADPSPPPPGFVRIPAGEFTMGDTRDDDADAPPVNVHVNEFYMATHEVTWELWNEVRTWGIDNGYTDIAAGGGKGGNHPVQTVSWWDVVKWCNARSEKDGLTPVYTVGGETLRTGTTEPVADWNANGYRLPTEAEWEKAARGGVAGHRFPWGDEIDHDHANYRANGSAYIYDTSPFTTWASHPTYATDSSPYTSPVGSFAPNRYGLYDMAGNVWEWNWDWYSASTYMNSASNPRGAESGSERVRRGGSSDGGAIGCRNAARDRFAPNDGWGDGGFRLARNSNPLPPPGFATIPAGTFTMGRTSGDTDTAAPPVNVHVSEFYMATHEVTWELWNEVRTWGLDHGYTDIATGGGKAADHPVQSVSWWDVVKWCNARSEKDGLTPVYTVGGEVMRTGTTEPDANWNATGYRLPTEAEWEKAARGGVAGQRFPWGDTISHANANFGNDGGETYQSGTTLYHPDYNSGATPYTSPVGSFAPNGYGLYDMAGNVFEWNWDWYSVSSYTEEASDPRGAGSGTERVQRGGAWNDYAINCRSAIRGTNVPGYNWLASGFRLARSSGN